LREISYISVLIKKEEMLSMSNVKYLTIQKSEVFNDDGTVDEEKCKKAIATLVTDIIENPENVYV
jgi:hypothetical protein